LFPAPYELARADKRRTLLAILNELDAHHEAHCAQYAKLRSSGAIGTTGIARTLEDLPFMPVRLFKELELKSVPDDQVFKVLHSSGTSAQTPSRIVLDRNTATLQTRALVAIMKPLLGSGRLPMLIVDSPTTVQAGAQLSARGAGIVGFSMLGFDHTYALDASLAVDWERVHTFLARNQGKPIFVFGFTFLIWQYFYRAAQAAGHRLDLGNATLLHGGGWKKLEAERVSPCAFSACLAEQFGISRVRSYYGMVEQVGSIFVECEAGRLHAPAFADVIVRDGASFAPQPFGAPGIVQVLSALPQSYPGHSLLTEDVGTVLGEDDCVCGKKGKSFSVEGRLPGVEARGCSDTFVRSPKP
jgi:hypothetical protein